MVYDASVDRMVMSYRTNSSHQAHRTANIVSGVIKLSPEKIIFAANYPFGAVGIIDGDETIHLGNSGTTSYFTFLQRTAGSDASGDSFGSVYNSAAVNEANMTSVQGNYYSQAVNFSNVGKYLLGSFGYGPGNPNPYGLQYNIGTIGGSDGSRTFSSNSTGTVPTDSSYSSFPKGFMTSGRIRYYSSLNRAIVFEGRHLYTISVDSSGTASISALQDINPNATAISGKVADVGLIEGTNTIVCMYSDGANSNKLTYRTAKITTGTNAAADSFVLGTKQEIHSTLYSSSVSYTHLTLPTSDLV